MSVSLQHIAGSTLLSAYHLKVFLYIFVYSDIEIAIGLLVYCCLLGGS